MDPSILQSNYNEINNNESYMDLIKEIELLEEFIEHLGFLEFGRDYILCQKYTFSLYNILTSVELTIGNIISCCKNGCVSDANILLRKYRDDLFFYLYLVVYDNKYKSGKDVVKMQSDIIKWIENDLSNLHISQVLKTIGKFEVLNEPIKKFKMQKKLTDIGKRLNDYAHSNGYNFYNYNINAYKENELLEKLGMIVFDLKYITISFVFLTTLCSPVFIMSTDYIDYLDGNETPPEGTQYLVAPFILSFIKENIGLIDDNCYEYFKLNTCMEI